jgi:hypothetical protein
MVSSCQVLFLPLVWNGCCWKGVQWASVPPLALGSVRDGIWDDGAERRAAKPGPLDDPTGGKRETLVPVVGAAGTGGEPCPGSGRPSSISRKLCQPPSVRPRDRLMLIQPTFVCTFCKVHYPHYPFYELGAPGVAAPTSPGNRDGVRRARWPAARMLRSDSRSLRDRHLGVAPPYSDRRMKKMRRASDDNERALGHHDPIANAMPPRPILPSCRWHNSAGTRLRNERHRSLQLRCLSR